jgi:glycosyltransferase involved in cell wall biosynthesis
MVNGRQMRVLLIIPKYYGAPWNEGVKNIARRLASYLAAGGHQVLVESTGDGVKTEEVGEYGEKIYYTEKFEDRHIKHRRPWVRGRLWRSMIELTRRVVDQSDPDAVVLFASASLFLGLRVCLMKLFVGSRLVLYVTGLNKPTFGASWLAPKVKVIVGSPFLLRWFPHATVVHPVTSIQFKADRLSNSSPCPQRPLSLLYLGTAQKERGVEYLLKAMVIALGRTKCSLALTLALNGIGEENHNQVKSLIANMGLEDIVSVKGIVDTSQAYRESDVVVIPRQEPTRMAFPVRILEALSFNKPLIVTNICDMGLLVEGCALVVDPKNPGDLASAIVNLAEDRRLLQRLSNNCPALNQKYAPRISLETISSVLKEVTNGRCRPN